MDDQNGWKVDIGSLWLIEVETPLRRGVRGALSKAGDGKPIETILLSGTMELWNEWGY